MYINIIDRKLLQLEVTSFFCNYFLSQMYANISEGGYEHNCLLNVTW